MPTTVIPDEPDSRLKVTKKDLDDDSLYQLNQVINHLYTKFSTLAINGKFEGSSSFADILLNTNRNLSTLSDYEVLNYGEIKKIGITTTTNTTISGGGGGGGGGTVPAIIQEETLIAPTLITSVVPTTDGKILYLFLTQDATGGRVIAFDSMFAASSLTQIDPRANYLTILCFVSLGGLWNQTENAFENNGTGTYLNGPLTTVGVGSGTDYTLRLRDTGSTPGISLYRGTTTISASLLSSSAIAFSFASDNNAVRAVILQNGRTQIGVTADQGYLFYVNGTSYFNGVTTHAGNVLPNGSIDIGATSNTIANIYTQNTSATNRFTVTNGVNSYAIGLSGSTPTSKLAFVNSVSGLIATCASIFPSPTLWTWYGDMYPAATHQYDLGEGTTPLRWKKLWVEDIDLSGSITGTSGFVTLSTTQTISGSKSFTSAILAGTTGINIGASGSPFADTFTTQGYFETVRVAVPSAGFGTTWRLTAGSVTTINHFYLTDPSNNVVMDISGGILGVRHANFLCDIGPIVDNTYGLGFGSLNWTAIWTKNVQSSTAMTLYTASGNIIFQPGGTTIFTLFDSPSKIEFYRSINVLANGATPSVLNISGATSGSSSSQILTVDNSTISTGTCALFLGNNGFVPIVSITNSGGVEILFMQSSGGATAEILVGNGSPNGIYNPAVGSLYLRSNGSTGTVLYVKETAGSGGWVAK